MDRTASRIVRARRRHAVLLSGCALVLVLAATPEAAYAQTYDRGFQGTANVVAGGANTTIGTNVTNIDVTGSQTVINWTPTDPATTGTIDFLPGGTTAAFSSSTLTDYTVLNRILPGGTATIGINGSITSTVYNDGPGRPAGNVWFYTPNGFVIGSNAVINVGGLIMTTNDITYSVDPSSGQANFYDANGAINFRGPDGSTGSIINGGSLIGNNSGSYIALIAPRIEQHGYVSADRSIAYVAGEQVDLKINAGNFDIVVGQGTDDANGIVHDGTTAGSASTSYADQKSMQFVAVPKNTALTMLLSGNIGYTPAAAVYSDGSAVVLKAGAAGSPDGNIAIGAADFSSRLDAYATGDLTVAPPAPGPFDEGTTRTRFQSYTNLNGDKSVHLTAAGGTRIEALNGLSAYSASDAGGGAIDITALAGSGLTPAGVIAVTGGLSASTNYYGATSDDGTTGLDGRGGSVTLAADGGQITADYTYLYARGNGGFGTKSGGDGYGGTVDIRAGYGGSIDTGYIYADAGGDGGGSYDYDPEQQVYIGGQGGVGTGGGITIADSSGSLADDPTGGHLGFSSVYLDASAIGGNSFQPASGMGGDAFGGTIDITLDRQDQSFGYLDANALAQDGDSGGLDPLGGTITMNVGGGISLNLTNLSLDASILASVNSPAGAFGRGGTIDLSVTDGASVGVDGTASLSADASVVDPFFGSDTTLSSPDVTGGDVSLTADGGSFQAQEIYVQAAAYNVGAQDSAGFAHGGTATVRASNGGSITAVQGPITEGGPTGGYLSVDVEGYGTGGGAANLVTGGDITLAAESGGTITADSGTINLYAGGTNGIASGGQATGVTAQGGTIAIDALGGTIATGIYADASAQGGDADFAGGSGTGGSIDVRVLGGTLVNSLYADASGSGGFVNVKGDGGDGRGGRFSLTSDAAATFTDFALTFYGEGQGGSSISGRGGDGYGGSAEVDVLGGTHSWSQAYLSAAGRGASSYSAGSLAGSGYGSVDGLDFHVGGGADLTLGTLTLDATGTAGSNGDGNEAIGGTASLLVDQLASLRADGIEINATGSLANEERSPESFDTTPNAGGGSASAIADGGSITTPFLAVIANGMTGGAQTAAGAATGGDVTVGASAGGAIDIIGGVEGSGELIISAQGLGAEGPSAAHATGGTATLYTAGGSISSVFGIVVDAGARGGDFADRLVFSGPANGFDATGGTASIEMRAGGSGGGAIDAPSLTVTAQGDASGISPVLGAGGTGTGGTATVSVAQGSLDTGQINVIASGDGGAANYDSSGGAGFAGGAGIGGSATFDISGGSVDATYLGIFAQGTGADGLGGSEGETSSLAGTGTGGSAEFTASGGTFNDSGALSVQAVGFGGAGAFNATTAPGLDGADAFGGAASFAAPAGGNAALTIGGDIRIDGSAFGGDGGSSYSEEQGNGGSATGGSAAMNLADIPFTFGAVQIDALASPGAGSVAGDATGGDAAFSLVDSTSTAVTPRTIDSLSLNGASYASAGAASIGGSTAFTAQVGNAGSALSITNDLSLYAYGDTGPAGYGFVGAISGAPVTVGGAVSIITPRDAVLTISGTGALNAGGDLDISVGRTFTSSGAISADGNATVQADGAISMTDLSVGGSTLLTSFGPVVVSHDLSSLGPVTVLGQSVSIFSLGGLTFADADAIGGDLEIETAGDLLLATVDATGAVSLTSNGGSIHSSGAVNGGPISYVAAGDVTTDGELNSGGDLTIGAGGLLTGSGPMTAAGNIGLSGDVGISLTGAVGAGGSVSLTSSSGSIHNSAPVTGVGIAYVAAGNVISDAEVASDGDLTVDAGGTFSAPGTVSAVGNVSLSADLGMALAGVISGGTTLLQADAGAISVDSLTSPGAVSAIGRSVTIASPGALNFTAAQATAGDLNISTGGNLAVAQGGATGSLTLTSSGGQVTGTGPIVTGGNTAISGDAGIALGTLTSGGTTALTSANGAVGVTNLNSAGAVTALGRAVTIGSSGALTFADLDATAGNVAVQTAADLAVGAVDATGSIALTSTGGALAANGVLTGTAITLRSLADLQLGSALSAPGAIRLTSTSGSVTAANPIAAGGNLTVSGNSGVTLGTASSGAATSLNAANGAVAVTNLTSAGAVAATGRSVNIGSSGALAFTQAQATAGNLRLTTTGNLTVAQGAATGTLTLTSSGGALGSTGSLVSGGNATLSGRTGIALASLSSGGASSLTSVNGTVVVDSLTSAGIVTAAGRSVGIASPGALSFANAQATAGNLDLTTAGNLSLAQAGATGTLRLTSTGGTVSGTGPVTSGSDTAVSGDTGIALAALTSGGTTVLTSANGAVGVGNLNSAGPVTASGRAIAIGSSGALTFADLDATAGNVAVQTAGNLAVGTVDAAGSVTLTSTGGALQTGGAINANGISLSSLANLQTTGLSTAGAISLTSTSGSVTATGPVIAGGSLAVSGDSGIALGTATSGGTTALTSANGAVSVTNLNSAGPVTANGRSATIGSSGALTFADLGATAGNVAVQTAGNLAVGTVDAAGSVTLTSTGGALQTGGAINASGIALSSLANLQTTGLSTAGAISLTSTSGSVTATGPVIAGGSLAVSGDSGIALGTATSGGTTMLTSANGAVGVGNLNSAGPVTASGRTVTIGSSGALTFADLDATAGNVAVQTAGDLAVGTVDAAGSVTLTSTGGALQTGGAINANGIALSSLANLQTSGLSTPGAIALASTGGSVSATGPVSAGGALAVSGNSGVSLGTAISGAATTLTAANGAIGVSDLRSAGAVTAVGRSATIGSTGALTFADLDATSGNVAVQAAGNLAVGSVDAIGSVTLASSGGALTATGPISASTIALGSLGNLQAATLDSAGALSLSSTSGSIAASGPVTAGGNVSASGRTGVSFGTLTSGGTTALSAADGAISVAALTSAGAVSATGRSVDLRSPGSLTIGTAGATSGDLILEAAQDLTVGNGSAAGTATLSAGGDLHADGLLTAAGIALSGANVTVGGQVTSSSALDIRASQLLTLGGLAAGTAIDVEAQDIAIGATGRLGSRGLTQTIDLRSADAGSPMNIGGTGQQGQFSLDKSEAARLFADKQISFIAASGEGGGGDVRIGDLAMAFGDQVNLGAGGLLKVDAGGLVEVNGAVTLTTVSAEDRFAIDPTRIEVVAGSGSIAMRSSGGALQGILELQAGTIAVADRTTLDTIAALSDFAAISKALDAPGPAGPAGGYLQAGTINLIGGDAIYIQNGGTSAAYDDRRGFLAGTLNIETGSSDPRIAINGVITGSSGDLVGQKTATALSINGVLSVDLPASASVTINGCAPAGCASAPEIILSGPTSEDLELVITTNDEGKDGPTSQLVQVENTEPLITPPLVDEPITGVGNDDLWQVKCGAEGDNSACPAEEGTE